MYQIKKEIRLGKKRFLAIDLTQPLSLDTKVYPGDPQPRRKVFSDINKTGWQHYIHEIGDHNFQPHADAPNHQVPYLQHRGIEVFGIDYSFNRACLIDLIGSNNLEDFEVMDGIIYKSLVRRKDLEPFKKNLANVGAVLIRTGYDKWLEKNKSHIPEKIPYLTQEAADFIVSFDNINVVGVDSLTIDKPGDHYSHERLRHRLVVESLVHLYEIPIEKILNFDLQTTPVRIVGATGGPVVAHALIKL